MVNNNQNILPEGWLWTTIGEICENPQYGWTTSACKQGKIKLLRTTDITSGSINWDNVPYCKEEPKEFERYLLHNEDILISRAGSVGFSMLISNPELAVFASYLIRFRLRTNIITKYFSYFLKSPYYWKTIAKNSLGIAIPNVNASKLKQINFPLAPQPEQQRIVSKIEELFTQLDAAEAALKRAKANLKRYEQSVLQAAITGELTREWREAHKDELEPASVLLDRIRAERKARWQEKILAIGKDPSKFKYEEPVGPDPSNLLELPEGWCWTTLPQIGELNRGKSKHRPRDASYLYGGKYPFIQTGDVRKSNGRISKYFQTYSDEGLRQSRLWPKGTLCITIAANIAETGILLFESCFPDSIVGFLPHDSNITVEFIEKFLRYSKSNLSRFAPATAQKNINLEILRNLAIPLAPFEEQRELNRVVELIFSIISQNEENISKCFIRISRIRQSILQHAFNGQLIA